MNDRFLDNSSLATMSIRYIDDDRFCGASVRRGDIRPSRRSGARAPWYYVPLESVCIASIVCLSTSQMFYDGLLSARSALCVSVPIMLLLGLLIWTDPGYTVSDVLVSESGTSTGHASRSSKPEEYRILHVDGVEYTQRVCAVCRIFRPPRSSHCKVCDRCVHRFDHHCHFVGCCIGAGNYTYLFLLMIACTLCSWIYFDLEGPLVQSMMRQDDSSYSIGLIGYVPLVGRVLMLVFMTAILAGCVVLLSFHVYALSQNKTTLEFVKERNGVPTELRGIFASASWFRNAINTLANPYFLKASGGFCQVEILPAPKTLAYDAMYELVGAGMQCVVLRNPDDLASVLRLRIELDENTPEYAESSFRHLARMASAYPWAPRAFKSVCVQTTSLPLDALQPLSKSGTGSTKSPVPNQIYGVLMENVLYDELGHFDQIVEIKPKDVQTFGLAAPWCMVKNTLARSDCSAYDPREFWKCFTCEWENEEERLQSLANCLMAMSTTRYLKIHKGGENPTWPKAVAATLLKNELAIKAIYDIVEPGTNACASVAAILIERVTKAFPGQDLNRITAPILEIPIPCVSRAQFLLDGLSLVYSFDSQRALKWISRYLAAMSFADVSLIVRVAPEASKACDPCMSLRVVDLDLKRVEKISKYALQCLKS